MTFIEKEAIKEMLKIKFERAKQKSFVRGLFIGFVLSQIVVLLLRLWNR